MEKGLELVLKLFPQPIPTTSFTRQEVVVSRFKKFLLTNFTSVQNYGLLGNQSNFLIKSIKFCLMKSKKFNIKHHGFIFSFPFQVFFSLITFSFCSCILRIPSVIYYILSFHPLQNFLNINVKEGKKIDKNI